MEGSMKDALENIDIVINNDVFAHASNPQYIDTPVETATKSLIGSGMIDMRSKDLTHMKELRNCSSPLTFEEGANNVAPNVLESMGSMLQDSFDQDHRILDEHDTGDESDAACLNAQWQHVDVSHQGHTWSPQDVVNDDDVELKNVLMLETALKMMDAARTGSDQPLDGALEIELENVLLLENALKKINGNLAELTVMGNALKRIEGGIRNDEEKEDKGTTDLEMALESSPLIVDDDFTQRFESIEAWAAKQVSLESSSPIREQSCQYEAATLRGSESFREEEEVTKSAKTLFAKKTKTLFHWLHPEDSKADLRMRVDKAWHKLSQKESEFYYSQVLGPFNHRQVKPMINPRIYDLLNLPMSARPTSDSGPASCQDASPPLMKTQKRSKVSKLPKTPKLTSVPRKKRGPYNKTPKHLRDSEAGGGEGDEMRVKRHRGPNKKMKKMTHEQEESKLARDERKRRKKEKKDADDEKKRKKKAKKLRRHEREENDRKRKNTVKRICGGDSEESEDEDWNDARKRKKKKKTKSHKRSKRRTHSSEDDDSEDDVERKMMKKIARRLLMQDRDSDVDSDEEERERKKRKVQVDRVEENRRLVREDSDDVARRWQQDSESDSEDGLEKKVIVERMLQESNDDDEDYNVVIPEPEREKEYEVSAELTRDLEECDKMLDSDDSW